MGRLEDKVAIITGGGTGIGRSAALMFADEGALVIVAGRRQAPLEQVVSEVRDRGGRAAARAADMEKPAQVRALADWALGEYGRVDILVNNAGHSSNVRSIRYVGIAEWESVLAVNLTGVYLLCQALLPGMLERGDGTIITVSSMSALKPGLLGGAPYSAAKAGVLNLMGHINAEFNDRGVRACAILPAEVDTPILDKRPLPPGAAARATMMRPDDVAEAILLCAALPSRTLIEQIVLSPTRKRDVSADIEAARGGRAPRK